MARPDLPQDRRERALRDVAWRCLRALGCSHGEADDLAQEAYLRLLRCPEIRAEARARIVRWILSVSRNLWIDLRRRQRRSVSVSWSESVEQQLAREWTESSGDEWPWADAARQCVAGLAPRTARIVAMFYREDRSRREIADELGMTEAGVKTALQRARAALRQCIERRMRCVPKSPTEKKISCSTRG